MTDVHVMRNAEEKRKKAKRLWSARRSKGKTKRHLDQWFSTLLGSWTVIKKISDGPLRYADTS